MPDFSSHFFERPGAILAALALSTFTACVGEPEPADSTASAGETSSGGPGPTSSGDATTGDASTAAPEPTSTGEPANETTTGGVPGGVFVVAVGEQGSILHCDETACVGAPSPVTTELSDVVVLAADRAYAVGSGGVALAWDGVAWTKMAFPKKVSLSALAAVDEHTLFAGSQGGLLFRHDGAAWSEFASPVAGDPERWVQAIDFSSPDFGLAVAGRMLGEPDSFVLRWDGAAWTVEREGLDRSLVSVGVASPAVAAAGGWATVGEPLNLITRDAQATWTGAPAIPQRNFVTGVSFASDSVGLAVTDLSYDPFPPAVVRWDGASWTAEDVAQAHSGVHLVDAALGFLIGWADRDGALVETWKDGVIARLPTDSTASALWGVHGIRLP